MAPRSSGPILLYRTPSRPTPDVVHDIAFRRLDLLPLKDRFIQVGYQPWKVKSNAEVKIAGMSYMRHRGMKWRNDWHAFSDYA